MDTNFWTTVINGSANLVMAGAMVLQTAIFYITFKFGFRELDKHRQKLKMETGVEYAKNIIQNQYQIQKILALYFEGVNFSSQGRILQKGPYLDMPNEFLGLYAKLYVLDENMGKQLNEMNNLFSQIQVCADFMKDHELIKLANDFTIAHGIFRAKIMSNLWKVELETESKFEDWSTEERSMYIHMKTKEFKNFIPSSFSDKNFLEINDFKDFSDKLKKYLLDKYIP